MKVLIVEDDVLIAMDLEFLVESFGHRVCAVAASSEEAIAQADRHRPDVTLMDIRLADGSSGIDAAREIHRRYGVRCIFLSANLDAATRAAVDWYEPIGFLGKPILPVLL
jgi:DNA-binding NarL/FixJ family response regulator